MGFFPFNMSFKEKEEDVSRTPRPRIQQDWANISHNKDTKLLLKIIKAIIITNIFGNYTSCGNFVRYFWVFCQKFEF